jgi:3-isopropylmalate/(R)-2-methylmalate dehydratase small subunit
MQPFEPITAVALPLLRDNIDTDSIIPSREITTVSKTGLAAGLFAGWRYISGDHNRPDPDFPFNKPQYHGARILLTGENFGCGSSREHAVWALADYGFRVLIAASFNPIFYRNCVRNGVAPATLSSSAIREIAQWVVASPQVNRLSVDLAACVIRASSTSSWTFAISAEARDMLLNGTDPIDATLKLRERIDAFRAADRSKRPWAYGIEAMAEGSSPEPP